ncbi:MAG: aminotransferase class I/II-fold pyridoxal phosphate-dependent enzyme [Clostridia bacterium]|nr:aminotransferase class I/II-fold pyridoxal phosphate-dependent enzyme [Clostridia bacterium]
METLLEKLEKINKTPMHMPGHKRNGKRFPYLKGFADIDVTEIDGFDNLHNAAGILKDSMENAARYRGADAAFYLINGTTCGILASVCAVLNENDKVIMARNCHKSVYNGIELAGAEPIFVYPERNSRYGISGSVNPCDVALKIEENPDAKLVIVTSPTYEGVISDIEEICKIAHSKSIPVLVDAAHGAHLGFYGFCEGAVHQGADICVESLHKTLPSLTQTAICYILGNLVSKEKLSEKLAVFETSSPSYILLSSIDSCIKAVNSNGHIFKDWNKNLDCFYDKVKYLENIEILKKESGFFDFDRSKIVIFPKNQSGAELAKTLRNENIEPEMTAPRYVICMTGAGDTKRSLKRLASALYKADKKRKGAIKPHSYSGYGQNSEMSFKTALKSEKVLCGFSYAEGKISGGYVWAYPPGVPVLVPGDKISREIPEVLRGYKENGVELCGNIKEDKILVIK